MANSNKLNSDHVRNTNKNRQRGRWIPLASTVASITVAATTIASLPLHTSSFAYPSTNINRFRIPLHINCPASSSTPMVAPFTSTSGAFNKLHHISSILSTPSSSKLFMAVTDPETLLQGRIRTSSLTSTSAVRKPKRARRVKNSINERRTLITAKGERKVTRFRVETQVETAKEKIITPSQQHVQTIQRAARGNNNNRRRASNILHSEPIATTPPPKKKRTRALHKKAVSLTEGPSTFIESSSKVSNNFNNKDNHSSKSRSSTMPGFMDRNNSGRHKSFRDGLKIAQSSNSDRVATQIKKALTSETANEKRRKVNSEAMYKTSASVPDSLLAFASEIHMESRITPKEEKELGTKTQESIRIQQIYDKLETNLHREPTDAEWCAAAGKINMTALSRALEDGIEAKNQLVTSNLRMVQGVVNLYIRNGLGSQYNAGDLMQDGTMALIRAAEKFEPERGFRFSTYAMYWIRSAVKRSQILQSRIINVPQRLHETHKKIMKIQSELKKEMGRNPTNEELSTAVGITEVQLERCLSAIAQKCFSLDAEIENPWSPNSADSNKDLYEILDSRQDDAQQREIRSTFMKEDLIVTLKRHLTPHEVDLLLLRYGLMDEKTQPHGFSGPLTIAEVSTLVGLKPDKVRRTINKSLRQLRHLIAHEWGDFERELY